LVVLFRSFLRNLAQRDVRLRIITRWAVAETLRSRHLVTGIRVALEKLD